MYRKIAGVLATALLVLPFAGGTAHAATDAAKYQTSSYDDCRFTSWYDDAQPDQLSGVLTGAADLRCTNTHRLNVVVTITDGVDDALAAPGPANVLVGAHSGLGVGTTVWSSNDLVETGTIAQVLGQVPAPPLGHVYTVDTIAQFSDSCTALGCNPPPPAPPAAPAAPGTDTGSGVVTGQWGPTCSAEHDGLFDVDCQWEFKVVGQAH